MPGVIKILLEKSATMGFSQFTESHSDLVMLPLLAKSESDSQKRWQLCSGQADE